MSQRRRAAEVAEKKAADAIRSDDIIEDVIPESKSWNSEQSQSSNGKPQLAGAAAKAKLGAAKPKGKDTEVIQLEEMADEEEKEKTMKFDQSKKQQESGGKRGEPRTHEKLVSAGKKGASVRWSKEKQEQEGGPDPDYKLNEENEDDKEAYKEEFQEEPVEEEENFEEEGEDQGEGENKEDRMHKIRVEAGKKAIATRKAHIKEQDPNVKSDKDADAVLHDQLSAIGKKGANARWSRDKDEDNGGDEENQGEEEDKEARMHNIRVEAGKKAMATRKQHIKEQDPGVQSDEEADAVLHEQLSAIGKKGAAARWSRDKGQGGDQGEGEEEEDEEEKEARLHDIRVQAGKKAMATRKQRLKEQDPGVQSDEEADEVLHEQLSAIGKKGASARWAREKGEGSAEEEEGDEDENEKAARLHKIRVEAGKKAAATRKAHAQQQQNSAGESEEEEPSTHEKLSAAGKKGASARWARAKKRDSEGENEGANGNMKKARASSRVAMEHCKS
ncbi:hypothetical protein GHT06_009482 [Daphnia sinensis]|uniref:Uncharacterized protein n=1 Tax=Daphnia sinensis TaxID=1820382 RepID=A0AAD5LMX8_9CRUS|nr:hypothetical protein GHT06_009482 [Daphnia sinensis]